MSDTHALNRTSPKGEPFIGTCMKCGKTGLTLKQANEECENPSRMTQDEALVNAVKGHPMTSRYELEAHIETAEKLLKNPEWVPSRLLWHRLTEHLKSAVAQMPEASP